MIQCLMEPLLDPLVAALFALEPLAETRMEPSFQCWNPLPADPSSGPFQR